MKYCVFALMTLLVTACHKNEEPCPPVPYENTLDMITVFKVIAFIDKDSNNLLMNHTIDTTGITVKDEKGIVQQLNAPQWLDSTLTKPRYISLPLISEQGHHTLTVTAKGKTNTIRYDFRIDKHRCSANSYFDNFQLNGRSYEFKPQRDYIAYINNGQKNQYPLYINVMYIVLQ